MCLYGVFCSTSIVSNSVHVFPAVTEHKIKLSNSWGCKWILRLSMYWRRSSRKTIQLAKQVGVNGMSGMLRTRRMQTVIVHPLHVLLSSNKHFLVVPKLSVKLVRVAMLSWYVWALLSGVRCLLLPSFLPSFLFTSALLACCEGLPDPIHHSELKSFLGALLYLPWWFNLSC